jgi:hypothetical protein
MRIRFLIVLFFSCSSVSIAQYTNSTWSPYSLFGFGKFNDANTGVTNSLGKAGVAMFSEYEINGLNSASLARINRGSFFFDMGLKTEFNTYGNRSDTDTKQTIYNFSNLSFAFPVGKKSGVSISLLPFTEVGYFFQGIVTDIEGSNIGTYSNINGKGGLNSFNVSYGRLINERFSLGLSAKYYFGSIEQTETLLLDDELLSLQDVNYYKGFKFELGLQSQLTPKLTTGLTLNFPSILNGSKDRVVNRIVDNIATTIDELDGIEIKDYKTPFDFTVGFKLNNGNFSFLADYKRTFWSSTGIEDNIGEYTDSNVIGFGMEYYKRNNNLLKQKSKFRYRFGLNYDDGNLRVNGNKISNSSITTGIGIPISKSYNTYMNFSYSFGSKGIVSNTLVRENYHVLTLNLSFEDLWFRKRLID